MWHQALARDAIAACSDAGSTLKRATSLFLAALRFRGRERYCPCCENWFSTFEAHGTPPRQDARCPLCHALERHRLVAAYLRAKSAGALTRPRVLHFAPERCLTPVIASLDTAAYVSLDQARGRAAIQADAAHTPFGDEAFDLILCNHVLEHIPDDVAVLREIRRLLSPTGLAIITVPTDPCRADTLEDPGYLAAAERVALFGQEDHVRAYGRDFAERVRSTGLAHERVDARDVVAPHSAAEFGLSSDEHLIVARRLK